LATASRSPDQLVEAALAGKVVPIDALSGTSLKRSRVNGEARLEVVGFDPRALPSWKAKGCFTEIIAYQTRLFMPVNNAREIVQGLRRNETHIEVIKLRRCEHRA
jgi:hypothetical protein